MCESISKEFWTRSGKHLSHLKPKGVNIYLSYFFDLVFFFFLPYKELTVLFFKIDVYIWHKGKKRGTASQISLRLENEGNTQGFIHLTVGEKEMMKIIYKSFIF